MASTNQLAWEQFAATSERYRILTDRQKVFVTAFAATSDAVASVKMAYQCADERNATVMSYQVSQNPNVAACIAEFQGKTEREIQLEALRRDLRKAKPGGYERAKFLALYLKMTGLSEPEAEAQIATTSKRRSAAEDTVEEPAQTFPIGAVIVQDGKRYEVKAEEIL